MDRSFFSSTVTRWSVSVLNTEKMSYGQDQSAKEMSATCTHHRGRRGRRTSPLLALSAHTLMLTTTISAETCGNLRK